MRGGGRLWVAVVAAVVQLQTQGIHAGGAQFVQIPDELANVLGRFRYRANGFGQNVLNGVRGAADEDGGVKGVHGLVEVGAGFPQPRLDRLEGVADAGGFGEVQVSGSWFHGTVTGTAVDTYTITVPDNTFIWVGAQWTPPGGVQNDLYVTVYKGATEELSIGVNSNYNQYDYKSVGATEGGTYTISVFRNDHETSGGAYGVHVFIGADQTSESGGGVAGAMVPGTTYTGSDDGSAYDIYDFNVTDTSKSLQLDFSTTGGTGLGTQIWVIKPDGS